MTWRVQHLSGSEIFKDMKIMGVYHDGKELVFGKYCRDGLCLCVHSWALMLYSFSVRECTQFAILNPFLNTFI